MEQFFGWVAMLAGAGAIGYAWLLHRRADAIAHWPTSAGSILESRVEREHNANTNGPRITFAPRIRYQYEVQGRSFTSDKIAVGGTLDTSSEQRAAERTRRWPVGATVPVFYNPRNPREAYLKTDAEGAWFIAAVGAVMGLVGLGFAGFIG